MDDTGAGHSRPAPLRAMLRTCSLLLLCAVSLSTATSSAAAADATAPLQPFRAQYEVLRNGERLGHGEVTLRESAPGRWEYLSHTRGTKGMAWLAGADIVERSTLRWHDGRLESLAYEFRQKIGWKERDRSVRFEPQQARIVSRDREREHVFAFQPGVLDRQAVVLALALDLAAGRRDALAYLVVDRDELGPQRYGVTGEETLQTAAGPMRTLRVERVRPGARARTTTSWLGLEQSFLPVRVLQREPDGDTFEMRLVSLDR
jgi:hypothetical protein